MGQALELFAAYQSTGHPPLLTEAVATFRLALAAAIRVLKPDVEAYYNNLGYALHELAVSAGDTGLLAEAVGCYRATVAAVAVGDADRGAYLCSLASALSELYSRTGDVGLLREAAGAAREAAGLTGGRPDPMVRLGILADALGDLYARTGDPAVIAESVLVRRELLAVSPASERLSRLSGLGEDLRLLFERTDDVAALAESVRAAREAVAGTVPGSPELALRATRLSGALTQRYERTGDPAALAEAITAARDAVAVGRGDSERAGYLNNLQNALSLEWQRTGDVSVLRDAVGVARDAVAAAPDGHRLRSMTLTALCGALAELYDRTGDTAALAESVEASRGALAATPADSPDRPRYLHNLAMGLHDLFERRGDTAALDEAASLLRAAVATTGDDDPAKARRLHSLSGILLEMADRTGDATALDEAVSAARAAVATAAPDDPARLGFLDGLGGALTDVYAETGNSAALAEAVRVREEALAATPEEHVDRVVRLFNLAGSVQSLAARNGDRLAVVDAWLTVHDALDTLPDDHPARSACLHRLSQVKLDLYRQSGDVADLDGALRDVRDSIAATPADHPELAGRLATLGSVLLRNREKTGDLALLPEALVAARRAVAATPVDAPARTGRLNLLTSALWAWYRDTGDPAALAEAIDCALAAARQPGAPAALRITAYRRAAELGILAGRAPREALDCVEAAVGLLSSVAPRDLARTDQEYRIGRVAYLAGHAAEAAVTAGCADRAVELLEQTRGVLVADELDSRAGHDHQRPLSVAELARYAKDGPIVYLYSGPQRCDALVLSDQPGPAAVRLIPLGMTTAAVTEHAYRLMELTGVQPTDDDAEPVDPVAAQQEILAILRRLRDDVAEPVLAALGHTSTPRGSDWPRVWWCPVGDFAYLPLHAVCLDRVVSSYIPTARGLRYARAQPSPDRDAATEPLIVAVPSAPEVAPLPGARQEAAAIAEVFPHARRLPFPTRARVLAAMPDHPIAHFACHTADGPEPGQAVLVLRDHLEMPLTLADIGALRLAGGLAFLSACETGVTTISLADESVHITGAFHLAGYKHVVGTLWPVRDSAATRLTRYFYRNLAISGTADLNRTALALHEATRSLKEHYPRQPALWAAYTHTGP